MVMKRWSGPVPPIVSGMRLRWRLVIAFLSVSVLPVLTASYIAADIISGAFASNMERWLQEAAMLFAERSVEDEVEARQAVSIVASSLRESTDNLDRGQIDLSAHLLTSVGYQAVAIYDADGRVLFANGPIGDGGWLPRQERSTFFVADDGKGGSLLLMGAAKRFESKGRSLYAFVANRWDGIMVNMADSMPGLVVEAYAVTEGKAASLDGTAVSLPPGVMEALAGGMPSLIAHTAGPGNLAAGFAALRDLDGHLVGIVTCRLTNNLSLLSHVRKLELFLMLSAVAGLFSLAVALSLSKLISRPLTGLSRGLQRVREGDFKTRIAEMGGGELTELAVGFNEMATRLEAMRARETEMRQREQLATLGEAAAVMAHEIRNPLGIIKTSTQVLRMKSTLSPEGEKMVDFVLDEVGRIDHLLHELLDYARPRTLDRQPVDVGAELAGVLAFAAPDLEQRGIRVAMQAPSGSFIIQADGGRLHQVFLNIILNAMDAMPGGGLLTCRVEQSGQGVVVSIADTGSGIDPSVRDRLFEPFVTTKPRGTGLGLARVRHILEQHGGTISCESLEGVGSLFVMCLPFAPASPGEIS